MKFTIIRPNSQSIYDDILWLEVNTPVGNFVFKSGHAPIILTLSPNKEVVFSTSDGTIQHLIVQGGILELTRIAAILIVAE